MNKSELSSQLTKENLYLTSEDVDNALNKLISFIAESMRQEKKIELRGFGSFATKRRSKRLAINPSNQAKVLVEEKLFPVFKPSKNMKSRINA